METLTRKDRERQEREERILDAAYRMVLAEGYLGLNLDQLAREVEYAKGTLYLHFRSKEDILLALAARTTRILHGMFERASRFAGRSRERMAAIGYADELFARLYPGHHKIEFLVRTTSIWEKASEEHRKQFEANQTLCCDVVTRVVREAIAEGDLTLDRLSPEEVTFGLWTLSLGAHTLVAASEPLQHAGIATPYASMRKAEHTFLDGLAWRPLTAQWNWDATYDRIRNELFPDEFRRSEHA